MTGCNPRLSVASKSLLDARLLLVSDADDLMTFPLLVKKKWSKREENVG